MLKTRMEARTDGYQCCRFGPARPPDWRRVDSRHLAFGLSPYWSSGDDPAVTEYAAYLRARRTAKSSQDRATVRQQWPAIVAARRIFRQNDQQRWLLEGYIVAGLADEEVSARCSVPAEVIAWYTSLFFDVRPRMKAWAWLIRHVTGDGMFRDTDVRRLWAWSAWAGGPLLLEHFVAKFREALRPGELPRLGVYLRDGVPLNLQASIAAMVTPLPPKALEAFDEFRLQLYELRAITDRDTAKAVRDKIAVDMVAVVRAALEGKRLPRRQRCSALRMARQMQAAKSQTQSSQQAEISISSK